MLLLCLPKNNFETAIMKFVSSNSIIHSLKKQSFLRRGWLASGAHTHIHTPTYTHTQLQ